MACRAAALAAGLGLCALFPVGTAHTWMFSRGRATMEASLDRPFRVRKEQAGLVRCCKNSISSMSLDEFPHLKLQYCSIPLDRGSHADYIRVPSEDVDLRTNMATVSFVCKRTFHWKGRCDRAAMLTASQSCLSEIGAYVCRGDSNKCSNLLPASLLPASHNNRSSGLYHNPHVIFRTCIS